MSKEEMSNDYLEKEGLGRLMLKYSVPCIISLLVGALYNIVDQLYIANADYLGSYGNSANSVVFPMTVIALAIAVMIGDGCCAFMSMRLGARDNKSAAASVGSAVTLVVASSIVLTAIYFIFSEQLITLFGGRVNDKTFELAKEYFFWITVGIPFYMFGQALNAVIRSDGSPNYAMATLLSGAVINVILDYIFIYPLELGMKGAALATIIGQIVAAILALIYLFRMKNVKLKAHDLVPNLSVTKRMIPLGLTSFLAQISMVISLAAVYNMVAKYVGDIVNYGTEDIPLDELTQIPTAIVGIGMKFFQMIISVSIGMAAGCIPVVGYNMGAGRNDRVKGLLTRMLIAELIFGVIATIICEVFPSQLIGLFGSSGESEYYINFGIDCIRIFLSFIFLACVNKGVTIYMQAMGKAFI
ncbi:MAG: polysaccharide biosynthesis C-terminal domain-containing protein, partial [Firmicutes bacterium]|nr:polysaccharide biosynthesis C-terminal domain-containing protein [Bacillota bacterium]